MTTEELRDHLRELKIPTGGSKFDLQSRLQQYHDGCQATDWLRPAEQQAATRRACLNAYGVLYGKRSRKDDAAVAAVDAAMARGGTLSEVVCALENA